MCKNENHTEFNNDASKLRCPQLACSRPISGLDVYELGSIGKLDVPALELTSWPLNLLELDRSEKYSLPLE